MVVGHILSNWRKLLSKVQWCQLLKGDCSASNLNCHLAALTLISLSAAFNTVGHAMPPTPPDFYTTFAPLLDWLCNVDLYYKMFNVRLSGTYRTQQM